ncbi:hypothetical protein MAINES_00170 [Brevundimonas phage vB_BpoS-MaInes]|nr:hypothetical protein MAINES_00170 [Brevundimonas phage vB_BpoS-MaInes]
MAAKQNAYLRKLVKRFEDACYALAFAGAQHPDDRPILEQEHKEAKAGLLKYCEERFI